MAIASFFAFIFLPHLLLIHSAEADDNNLLPICPDSFQCGNHSPISFPFTNNSFPHCGYVVDCDQTVPNVHLGRPEPYELRSRNGNTIEIHDPMLEWYKCYGMCNETFKNLTLPHLDFISFQILNNLTFFKCNDTPQTQHYFSSRSYTSYKDCTGYSLYYRYPDDQPTYGNLPDQCEVIQLPALWPRTHPPKDRDSQCPLLTATFHLEFHISNEYCLKCNFMAGKCLQCHEKKKGKRKYGWILGTGSLVAVLLVAITLLCWFRRKCSLVISMIFCKKEGENHQQIELFRFRRKCSLVISMIFCKKEGENHQQIELFLNNYGSLAPKRYSYSDVKKMTNSFANKLGQGGYGGVYKGKLQNGHLVAVKVLTDSKGNGEEFTNEVASISRTSHVNVVTLLGFCFEGSKRALIYEFMPNGSLEKFIYDESSSIKRQLGWETLYQIAVGIARGLEYLHRGCNTRILHFDIKPHNILLDEGFCPKIADFGLSKLCTKEDSIISMLGARGTAGYIAPEIFSRSFGVVSHKSDVYSYGMMVLEMVGGRKNIDVGVDHTSEIYFPYWIYNRVELDEDLGVHGIMNEEENERAKKMIIVGLWCIQTNPSNRPSINKVMEMLEGSLETLQIPPKPFLSSPPRPPADSSTIQIL